MADHVMGNSARRSYGYSENTGSWSIDLGRLDADSVEALNRMADNAIQVFRQAFADLCTVEYAEGDLVEIGDNHQVSNVWAEVPLEQDIEGRFRPAPDAGPTNASDRAGLSRVLFSCGVEVDGDPAEPTVLSDALYFHYNSGLSSGVEEPITFDAAHATVSAEIDPWLDAPLQGGRFLDNQTIASLNRPRLERALRSWEAAVGRPIDDVESGYPDFVDRYGFRPGGEPDPPDV